MFSETLAIKAIITITNQFAKMVEKIDKAVDALNQIITNNKFDIKRKEEKNKELLERISEAEVFKNNLEKMFKKM